ncbi:MAG: hypothetical protein Q7S70_01160, partial [bacterium]|nr:hypothetical protein [bacterium]
IDPEIGMTEMDIVALTKAIKISDKRVITDPKAKVITVIGTTITSVGMEMGRFLMALIISPKNAWAGRRGVKAKNKISPKLKIRTFLSEKILLNSFFKTPPIELIHYTTN